MKVYRGVVVSVQDENYIVVTPEGELMKVKKNGQAFDIGQEILFYQRIKPRQKKHWSHSRAFRYTAGLAAGILFFFNNPLPISDLGGLIGNKNDAYAASIYVESKSNVKIRVNRNQEVVSVEPLNNPAKIVLKGMDWNGGQISDFVVDYFAAAKQTGYLGPCDKAIIAVDPANNTEKDNTIGTIQKDVNQNPFIKQNDIEVLTVAVPDVIVEKAQELGVTPGKLSIYLAASATGEKMPLDMVKVASVTDLVDAVPVVAKVLPTYSDKQLAQLVQQSTSAPKTEVAVTQPNATTSNTTTTQSATPTTQNVTSSKDAKPSGTADSSSASSQSSNTVTTSDKQSDTNQTPQQQSKDNSAAAANPSPSKSDNAQQQPTTQKQPESQTKEGQDNSMNNPAPQNSPGPAQTQQPEQPKDNSSSASSSQQPDQTKPQPDQAQKSETQASQAQSNQSQSGSQPQGQPQGNQPQSSQAQDSQAHPTQPQGQPQDDQGQNDQGQNDQGKAKQPTSNQKSVTATILGLVNKIIG